MRVKDIKHSYNKIEVVEANESCTIVKPVCIMNVNTFKKKYAERNVLSIFDFDDTRTTSVVIEFLNEVE